MYLVLIEQLGSCLKELKTLEKASSMEEARSTLSKFLAAQEHERKEMEEQIAEEARHLQHFQADYRRLVGDSKESEIVIHSASKLSRLLRLLSLGRKS